MPCTYYDDDDYRRMDADLIDKLTRMLCTARKMLERGGGENNATPKEEDEVYAWWAEHRKADIARAAQKARNRADKIKRDKASSKLTAEEREILGIR